MLLEMLGKRYGKLPCEVLGIDPASPLGWSINVAALAEGLTLDQEMMQAGGPAALMMMGAR